MNNLKIRLGFQNCFAVDCQRKRGGIALLWQEQLVFNLIYYSQNHIDGGIEFEGKFWQMTCFYGHPEEEKRQLSWDLMRWLKGSDSISWLIGRDFNGILSHDEKWGGNQKNDKLINDFSQAMDDCNLIDLGFSGEPFTWCNRRPNGKTVYE